MFLLRMTLRGSFDEGATVERRVNFELDDEKEFVLCDAVITTKNENAAKLSLFAAGLSMDPIKPIGI